MAGNVDFFPGLVVGSVCAVCICGSVEVTIRAADGSADEGWHCYGSQHFRSKQPLMPPRCMVTRRPSNARQPRKGWLKRWQAALPPLRPLTGASGMAPARLWELTHRGSTPRSWSGLTTGTSKSRWWLTTSWAWDVAFEDLRGLVQKQRFNSQAVESRLYREDQNKNALAVDLFCFITQETLTRAFLKAREFIGTLESLKAAALQLFQERYRSLQFKFSRNQLTCKPRSFQMMKKRIRLCRAVEPNQRRTLYAKRLKALQGSLLAPASKTGAAPSRRRARMCSVGVSVQRGA